METNRIQNPQIAQLLSRGAPTAKNPAVPADEFGSLLDARLKVSGHAKTRLESRNIEMNQGQWDRVMQGVDKAAAKGAKESLVLVDDVALLVSVKNRTVITAVDQQNMKENVFTNIDSAVIV